MKLGKGVSDSSGVSALPKNKEFLTIQRHVYKTQRIQSKVIKHNI